MIEEPRSDVVLSKDEFRTRVLVMGGLIGTALGLISAILYLRAAEDTHGEEGPVMPRPRDAMRLGISLISIIRTITDWGRK